MSNYHSFGHQKFIPDVSEETFLTILKSNPYHPEQDSFYQTKIVGGIFEEIKTEIFNIDKPYTQLNFPEEGGVTGYFGRNITKTDLELIKEFLVD